MAEQGNKSTDNVKGKNAARWTASDAIANLASNTPRSGASRATPGSANLSTQASVTTSPSTRPAGRPSLGVVNHSPSTTTPTARTRTSRSAHENVNTSTQASVTSNPPTRPAPRPSLGATNKTSSTNTQTRAVFGLNNANTAAGSVFDQDSRSNTRPASPGFAPLRAIPSPTPRHGNSSRAVSPLPPPPLNDDSPSYTPTRSLLPSTVHQASSGRRTPVPNENSFALQEQINHEHRLATNAWYAAHHADENAPPLRQQTSHPALREASIPPEEDVITILPPPTILSSAVYSPRRPRRKVADAERTESRSVDSEATKQEKQVALQKQETVAQKRHEKKAAKKLKIAEQTPTRRLPREDAQVFTPQPTQDTTIRRVEATEPPRPERTSSLQQPTVATTAPSQTAPAVKKPKKTVHWGQHRRYRMSPCPSPQPSLSIEADASSEQGSEGRVNSSSPQRPRGLQRFRAALSRRQGSEHDDLQTERRRYNAARYTPPQSGPVHPPPPGPGRFRRLLERLDIVSQWRLVPVPRIVSPAVKPRGILKPVAKIAGGKAEKGEEEGEETGSVRPPAPPAKDTPPSVRAQRDRAIIAAGNGEETPSVVRARQAALVHGVVPEQGDIPIGVGDVEMLRK